MRRFKNIRDIRKFFSKDRSELVPIVPGMEDNLKIIAHSRVNDKIERHLINSQVIKILIKINSEFKLFMVSYFLEETKSLLMVELKILEVKKRYSPINWTIIQKEEFKKFIKDQFLKSL